MNLGGCWGGKCSLSGIRSPPVEKTNRKTTGKPDGEDGGMKGEDEGMKG